MAVCPVWSERISTKSKVTIYSTQNNQQAKRIFNNVPPEQAGSIVRTIMGSDYESPVEVNFAPPTLKSGSPFIPLDELKDIIDADILPE